MSYFNNIYAAAYRCYDKYENSARYSAASLVFIHLLGLIFLLVAVCKRVFLLDFTIVRTSPAYKLMVVVVLIVSLRLLWRYYSEERVQDIVWHFEKKPVVQRRMWGYVAVVVGILEYTIAAILLS